jgi:hypothetical protein
MSKKDLVATLEVPLRPLAADFLHNLLEQHLTEVAFRAANLSSEAEADLMNLRNQLAAHLQRVAKGA